ncbi:MAG TPA: helix-turn-helix domain-containing protein [Solirubrobacterales bacterium]|nr:helix-turn-helix domain-containing protein [Solirubrobacterales bacterium]
MNVAKPFAAISSGVDADVLVALAGSTRPRSGRELARRAGRSNTGVQHVLERLVEHGLVNQIEAGRTNLYTLNWDHLLAPAVEQMAGAREELTERLRDAIGAWGVPAVHASLFGSAARGDGDAASDIDLFIVRPAATGADDPAWREQVDRLAESVRSWTGNSASVADVSEEELHRLQKDRPPIMEELKHDAVDLFGQSTRGLLRQL